MTVEPLHEDYGITLSEWIRSIPEELPRDAVGIFQIVPAGRDGFRLKGADLVDFIRRAIHGLLDAGALPVRGGGGTNYEWIVQHQYGTEKFSMTEAIIAEWLAMPDDPSVLCGEGVWFARPKSGTNYIKFG